MISPQYSHETLHFKYEHSHLHQKFYFMDSSKFELFAALLEDEKIYLDPSVTFERICGWLETSPAEMDSYLMDTIGYSGDDILKTYRGGMALYFMEKYGISL